MTPQEMIDVIQAHADGKQIQMRPKEDAMWIDCKPPSPMFDFCHHEYRVKVTLRPHWPALIRCRGVEQPVMGDTLFPTEDAARKHYTCMDTAVIRLATEYPPVMLP